MFEFQLPDQDTLRLILQKRAPVLSDADLDEGARLIFQKARRQPCPKAPRPRPEAVCRCRGRALAAETC